jgi:hypothetical protein
LGDEDLRVATFTELVNNLPPMHQLVLNYLVNFLNELTKHSEKNLMTTINIGIIFGPTILKAQVEADLAQDNSHVASDIIVLIVQEYKKIFPPTEE